jgi:hypothetical protein
MVQLVLMRFKARRYIPKGIKGGQLTKEQLDELVPTIEITGSMIAIVSLDTFSELIPVHIL